MKKILLFALIQVLAIEGYCQVYQNIGFGTNGTGMIVRGKSTVSSNVEGSFYLFDVWLPGRVRFSDDSVPVEASLKYDVNDNLLLIKGASGEENEFTSPIGEFDLQQLDGSWIHFKKGYNGPELTEGMFLQSIYNGTKVAVFKKEFKTLLESRAYNSASVSYKVDTSVKYYMQTDVERNNLVLIKLDVKSVSEALGDPKIADFAKSQKLNLKKQESLVKLLNYYEGL